MDFLTLASERYSCRSFSKKKVEQEKVEKILKAAQVAPTACNIQPQRILLIQDEDNLKILQKCSVHHFNETLAFIISYDKTACYHRGYDKASSGEIDASIVATHMMLEGYELGIGSTWIMHFIKEAVINEFHLPEEYEPVCILLMGYPSEDAFPFPGHSKKKEISEFVIEGNYKK